MLLHNLNVKYQSRAWPCSRTTKQKGFLNRLDAFSHHESGGRSIQIYCQTPGQFSILSHTMHNVRPGDGSNVSLKNRLFYDQLN